MAYSRVTRTNNGRGAIEYAQGKGKGHNGKQNRNEYIGMVNMLEGVDPILQMEKYWMRANKRHTTQVLRIVQSFSKKELNPENRSDILTANNVGTEFAREFYPGRQAMVFTQTDGKSGLVHNHIIVNDVHMETSKACENIQYYWPQITKWTDKIASKHFTLDDGKEKMGIYDKNSQMERTRKDQDKYVWKDDLRERVMASYTDALNEEVFFKNLEKNGVGVRKGKSKKYGEYYTYELKDLSRVPKDVKLPDRALKSRSYKLGETYTPEIIKMAVFGHYQEQREKEEAKQREKERKAQEALERKQEAKRAEERRKEQEQRRREQEVLRREQEEKQRLEDEKRRERKELRAELEEYNDWCRSKQEWFCLYLFDKDDNIINGHWIEERKDKYDALMAEFKAEKEMANRAIEEPEVEELPIIEPILEEKKPDMIDYSKKVKPADNKKLEDEINYGKKAQKVMAEEAEDKPIGKAPSERRRKAMERTKALQATAISLEIEHAQNNGIQLGI